MGIGPTCFFTNYTIFHFSKKTMFFRKKYIQINYCVKDMKLNKILLSL